VKKTRPDASVVTLGGLYERWESAGHVFYVPGEDGAVAQVVYDESKKGSTTEYLHTDPLGSVGGGRAAALVPSCPVQQLRRAASPGSAPVQAPRRPAAAASAIGLHPAAPSSRLLRAAGPGSARLPPHLRALATPRRCRAAPLQAVATAPGRPAGLLQALGGRVRRGIGSCRRSGAGTRPFRATFQLGASEFQPGEGAPGGVAGGPAGGVAASFFTRRELPSFRKKASASAGRDR
jgi:hypothetical protein